MPEQETLIAMAGQIGRLEGKIDQLLDKVKGIKSETDDLTTRFNELERTYTIDKTKVMTLAGVIGFAASALAAVGSHFLGLT